jgi:hypothetical protein
MGCRRIEANLGYMARILSHKNTCKAFLKKENLNSLRRYMVKVSFYGTLVLSPLEATIVKLEIFCASASISQEHILLRVPMLVFKNTSSYSYII